MRSIQDDLQHRMTALEAERQKLLARLKEIDSIKGNLNQVMQAEKTVFSKRKNGSIRVSSSKAAGSPEVATGTLTAILGDLLADRKAHLLGEITQGVVNRGYDFGDKAPGRVVHFALLNMSNHNRAERLDDGGWRLPKD